MGNDHVAVVTRTRHRPLLLARAVASVLDQTHADWTHVIVNDGGDQAEVEGVVAPRRDAYAGRLRVLHHAAPLGMEAASNAGIAACDSRWIAIHDDDDTWRPTFLERALAAIVAHPHGDCRGAVTWAERIEERITPEGATELWRAGFNDRLRHVELWRLLQENLFPPIAFLFARDACRTIGGFDAALPVLGDWDFNLRFCARFEIAVVPEHLAGYHHRVPGTPGAYANTVVDGAKLHESYRAWLVNRWLRQDLAAGRVGIGVLAAIAGDTAMLRNGVVHSARSPRATMRRLLRRIAPNGTSPVTR